MKRFLFKRCFFKASNNSNSNKRKGATLAEIMVALAVVAIISISVVTFTSLLSSRTTTSAAKLNALDDIQLCERFVDMWIERMLTNGGEIQVEEKRLYCEIEGTPYAIGFVNGTLEFYLPVIDKQQFALSVISGITFDKQVNDSTGDTIYFCNIKYEIPTSKNLASTFNYVFSVSPHSGDVLTGGAS